MTAPEEPLQSAGRSRLGRWAAVATVLVLGFALRAAHYREGYGHPDEVITREVVGYMRQSGDWDTNWAKAPNLEAGLRYDQYNFSSHLFATFGFYRLVKVLPGTEAWRSANGGFWVYRFFSVVLAAIAVWQAMRLASRLGGRGAMLGAGVLVAVAPLLVQDAHFARPEAFVTSLTLLAVALSWPREKLSAGAVLGAGAVVGVLVACKVSMLALAWLPLVPLIAAGRVARARWEVLAGLPLAMAAGFAAGAPGVLAHPDVFVSGIKHLMAQYAGAHPPHSHPNGGPVGDMMAAYFVATLGWPLLVAMVGGGAVLAVRRRWVELILLAGPVAVFVGYFATRSVFFERNLSHVVPLAIVLAAVGVAELATWAARIRRVRAGLMIGVMLLPVTLPMGLRVTWPLVAREFSGDGAWRHREFEDGLRANYPEAGWREVTLLDPGALEELAQHFRDGGGPLLLRVSDYHDEWTALHLPLLLVRFDMEQVAESRETFPGMPTCTLLTYHSPRNRYWLVTRWRPGT